jgi:hypothetical protein
LVRGVLEDSAAPHHTDFHHIQLRFEPTPLATADANGHGWIFTRYARLGFFRVSRVLDRDERIERVASRAPEFSCVPWIEPRAGSSSEFALHAGQDLRRSRGDNRVIDCERLEPLFRIDGALQFFRTFLCLPKLFKPIRLVRAQLI